MLFWYSNHSKKTTIFLNPPLFFFFSSIQTYFSRGGCSIRILSFPMWRIQWEWFPLLTLPIFASIRVSGEGEAVSWPLMTEFSFRYTIFPFIFITLNPMFTKSNNDDFLHVRLAFFSAPHATCHTMNQWITPAFLRRIVNNHLLWNLWHAFFRPTSPATLELHPLQYSF